MIASIFAAALLGADFHWQVSRQTETAPGSGRWHRVAAPQRWPAAATALIVCDVWDSHTSPNAVAREAEMVGRINQFVERCRNDGAVVIHAPSDTMKNYAEHPCRRRALAVPKAASFPKDIGAWCKQIPAEEKAAYPLDQSDGGADDEPNAKAAWNAQLRAEGRDPKQPWRGQHPAVRMDGARDYLTDRGEEVWSILQARGVKHVLIAGVHANMCVLGRPFGLRRLASNGLDAVLVRDLTDTMYNPKMKPFVSHFSGTDLIVDHIERHVCGTVSSAQLLGGAEFRFAADRRPTVAVLCSEPEYRTERTVPAFAAAELQKDCRVRLVFGKEADGNDLPGVIDAVAEADVLLVSARRRALPTAQLDAIRKHVAAGKGVVGIRTASHAFALRKGEPPAGTAVWPEFDREVFGGNYSNHTGKETLGAGRGRWAGTSPLLAGLDRKPFVLGHHLYLVTPLAPGAEPLAFGTIPGVPEQPIAWSFRRADGGKSFYTSLGAEKDFADNPDFRRMLANAVRWAAAN